MSYLMIYGFIYTNKNKKYNNCYYCCCFYWHIDVKLKYKDCI